LSFICHPSPQAEDLLFRLPAKIRMKEPDFALNHRTTVRADALEGPDLIAPCPGEQCSNTTLAVDYLSLPE
jgi:hypothetical protein